ncbi:MAG: hypothetical protein RSC43_00210 [Clostridia bacterium]
MKRTRMRKTKVLKYVTYLLACLVLVVACVFVLMFIKSKERVAKIGTPVDTSIYLDIPKPESVPKFDYPETLPELLTELLSIQFEHIPVSTGNITVDKHKLEYARAGIADQYFVVVHTGGINPDEAARALALKSDVVEQRHQFTVFTNMQDVQTAVDFVLDSLPKDYGL